MRRALLIRNALLVAISLALAACTSMRVVPSGSNAISATEGPASRALAPGDVVNLRLRNGSSYQFTVTTVSDGELQGVRSGAAAPEAISVTEIEVMERRQFDALKTTLLVVVIVAGIYFVAQALLVTKLLGSA